MQVPFWQSRIVQGCRKRGKPVIVATNMLESMIENPTPTRAEVSDIAIAVREGADAIMLSGETAYGRFPFKSVAVMATVAKRTESSMLSYQACFRLVHVVLLASHGKLVHQGCSPVLDMPCCPDTRMLQQLSCSASAW